MYKKMIPLDAVHVSNIYSSKDPLCATSHDIYNAQHTHTHMRVIATEVGKLGKNTVLYALLKITEEYIFEILLSVLLVYAISIYLAHEVTQQFPRRIK